MIRFDPKLLSVEIVQLKAVSTALGGGIMIVDQDVPEHEELKRIPVPFAVARDFIERHAKMTKYLRPVYTAVVRYADVVVAMERHPAGGLGILVDDKGNQWTPISKLIVDQVINNLDGDTENDWFVDGRYIYKFSDKSIEKVLQAADPLTENKTFRKVTVETIDMADFHKPKVNFEKRACIAFVHGQDWSISPPIWKSVDNIGSSRLNAEASFLVSDERSDDREKDTNAGNVLARFDSIDQKLCVNLEFALRAGKDIGRVFGYETIQPLQLPRLMTELRTVNLPSLPKFIKSTYDIGMSFTHTLAWLLGMQKRANTLEAMIAIRGIIKHLTKRGIYRRNSLDVNKIFVDVNQPDVARVDLSEFLAKEEKSLGHRIDIALKEAA